MTSSPPSMLRRRRRRRRGGEEHLTLMFFWPIYRYGQIWLRNNLTQIWIGFCPPPLKRSLFYIYCILNLSVPFYLPWFVTVNAIEKDFKQVSAQNSSENPNLPNWSLPSAFKNLSKHWKLQRTNDEERHLFTSFNQIQC